MESSHPIADGIARCAWKRARVLRLAAFVLAAAAALAGPGAQAAFAADPVTVTLSVSPTAVPLGGEVTMTATVTSPLGSPDGFVSFVSAGPTAYDSGQLALLPTSDPNTYTLTFVASDLGPGNYVIRALYSPSVLASVVLGLGSTYSTASQALTVGSTVTPLRPTEVILSAPTNVDATTPVTLTATVRELPAGGIPTGAVQFVDLISGSPIELRPSTVPLVNGVAQLVTTLEAGPHKILATYTGDSVFAPSSSPQLLINSSAPVDTRVITFADVLIAPSPIASGDTVTITASITQQTASGRAPATGGSVIFTATRDDGYDVLLGSAPLDGSTGLATIQNSTLGPGEYTVIADYGGNLFGFRESSAEGRLSVLPARAATDIAYSGDSTVAFGHAATLSATITAHGGSGLAGRSVTFTLLSQSCTATTDAHGFASCPLVATPATAVSSVTVSVPADVQTKPATLTVPFAVTPTATSLTFTGTPTAAYHGPTALSARLTGEAGVPVPNRLVTFTLGSQTCTGTTDVNGLVSCAFGPVSQNAGPYTLQIAYLGDTFSGPSATAVPFTVTRAQTTLTATMPIPGATSTTLSATLREAASQAPLAGRPVTLTFGSSSCTVTTNSAGLATCPLPTPAGSSATFTATFAGDPNYSGSTDTRNVTLLRPTVVTYTGPANADYHDPVLLSGTLTGPAGALAGRTLTFTLGSQSCTGTTSSTGRASCLLFITQAPGATTVTVSFAADATYNGSSSTAPFTITREETALIAKVADAVINGASISLSAVLVEDDLTPIANGSVTLTLGTATCTATTNALGVATCPVPRASTLGSTTFTAAFAGDTYYLPATTTRSTIVCAFPAGGSFVIGDRDNGAVTFWGAQWSKQNHLSHGDAPSAFKGWATGTFDQSWSGGEWSSDTGSSGSQPAGPLPAYMAVIQTGSTRKSGSKIYGDTVRIVVVRTNSGYAPNAGHDGTGTVVATVR